jgi:hypothetical protein
MVQADRDRPRRAGTRGPCLPRNRLNFLIFIADDVGRDEYDRETGQPLPGSKAEARIMGHVPD